jgi:hypothetical protein
MTIEINYFLIKYCFMQTHECRLKLDAVRLVADKTGLHLLIVRVAIYVAYLRTMYSAMQHKESIPEHLLT